MGKKQNMRYILDNIKHLTICITGISEGNKRKNREEIFKYLMARNSSNIMKSQPIDSRISIILDNI